MWEVNAKFNSNHPSTELNLNEKYLRRKKKNAFKLSKIPFLRILIFACFHIAVRELEKIYRFIDLHLFMPRQNRYLFASWIRLKSKFNPRLGKIRSRSRVQASRSPIIRNRYPAWPIWPKLKRGIERILLGSIHPPITIIAFFTVVAEEKKRRKNPSPHGAITQKRVYRRWTSKKLRGSGVVSTFTRWKEEKSSRFSGDAI